MFLFSCCTQFDNNEAYELRAKNQTQKEFQVIKNINNSVNLIPFDTQVLKVKENLHITILSSSMPIRLICGKTCSFRMIKEV